MVPEQAWRPKDAFVSLGLSLSLMVYYLATPVWAWGAAALAFVLFASRRLDLALLAVLITVPFYRFPKPFEPALFGLTQRTEPLRFSLAEFTILGCSLGWLLARQWPSGGAPRWPRWTLSHLASPPVALLAAATLTLPFSQYLTFSLRAYRTIILEPLIFYFLLRQALVDFATIRRTVDAVLALALGMGVFSLGHYFMVRVTEATGGVQRVLAIYHSPNALALFLGRLLPVALALLAANLQRRALAASSVLVTAFTLLFTYSRGAWIALVGAVVALGWLAGGRARWLALGGSVAALLVALALLPGERLRSEATVQLRLNIWESSIQMLRERPLVGVGLDNFLYYYPLYVLPEARQEPEISHPHNLILDFWLSTGILGLASFVWLQVSFWRWTRAALRAATGTQRLVAFGLAASMVVTLLHGLIDNSFFLIDLAFFFWLTYALMAALAEASAQ